MLVAVKNIAPVPTANAFPPILLTPMPNNAAAEAPELPAVDHEDPAFVDKYMFPNVDDTAKKYTVPPDS